MAVLLITHDIREAVFLSDPGFLHIYQGYGFEAHPVNLSEPMPPEQMAKFWEDFINGHIPNFRKSPYDQIDNYVKDCWTAIVALTVRARGSRARRVVASAAA